MSVVRKEKESINTHVDSNKNPAICVFNYWKQAMHKDSRCKPDIKRLDAITARLRDGFSVEELHEAVHGNLLSAWHQGKNEDGRKFDDIGLICRDSQQTLKFIEIARAQTKKKATVDERWEFLEPDVIEGECSHGKCVGL